MRKYYQPNVLASFLVAFAAVLPLIHPHGRRLSELRNSIASLGVIRLSHLLSIATGFLLLYFSIQIYNRKRMAYWITVVSLILLIIFGAFRSHHLVKIIFYVVALIFLVVNRRSFSVKSDNLKLRRGVFVALSIFLAALIYGTLGFYFLERRDFGIDFTVWQSFKYAFLQIVVLQNQALVPNTEDAEFFLHSLDIVSFIAAILMFGSLFRPVRFALKTGSGDNEKAREILDKYSTSVEDYFKLWPDDKHYFFNKNSKAFLAYKTKGDCALILDGPSGMESSKSKIIAEFTYFAEEHGWSPAIIHADDVTSKYATKAGYKSIFIGNEALVDVQKFCQTTHRSKHFRYVENKSRREELSFQYWEAPLTDNQLKVLSSISNAWVGREGRREYTYSMGYFTPEYLRQCDVAVLYKGDTAVAYANIIPSFVSESRSVDHMRHLENIPSTSMHFLLKELIFRFNNQGVKWFNLGLSPLSGLEEKLDTTLPEKILKTIKDLGSRYYSFRGLEQFKNKFEPTWEPRYILYRGSSASLLKVVTNLNRAMNVPNIELRRKRVVAAVAVLAGLTYVSFPVALLLDRANSGSIISVLGAKGHPYAWVFNTADAVSGLLIMGLAAFVYRYSPSIFAHKKRALIFYAIGGFGGLLSALAPLPITGTKVLDSTTMFHAFLSGINFFGIFFAAVVYVAYISKSIYERLLFGLLAGTGLTAVILESYGRGATVQRAQVIFVAIWISLLAIRLYSAKTQK